jgi:hypothetical protein
LAVGLKSTRQKRVVWCEREISRADLPFLGLTFSFFMLITAMGYLLKEYWDS